MFAYDYLKENPRINNERMKGNWLDLFKDPEVPFAVKQELIDLEASGMEITDAMLYFHGVYLINKLVYGNTTFEIDHFNTFMARKTWVNTMYSWIQINEGDKEYIDKLFLRMLLSELPDVPVQAIKSTLTMLKQNQGGENMFRSVLMALRGPPYTLYNLRSGPEKAFDYMTVEFIATSSADTFNKAIDLFRDVPRPTDGVKYKSLNELERAHDLATAKAVEKLLSKKPVQIVYHDDFITLVKTHGFKLPITKNDMIKRGAEHHNCVATYADQHCSNHRTTLCRLIFSQDATAELSIHYSHGVIVAVMVPQYKGRYNKDIEVPEALTHLRIALTGLPKNIVEVKTDDYD